MGHWKFWFLLILVGDSELQIWFKKQFRQKLKNSNSRRFINSYVLKWYEARRLKKINLFGGVKFCTEVWSLLKNGVNNFAQIKWNPIIFGHRFMPHLAPWSTTEHLASIESNNWSNKNAAPQSGFNTSAVSTCSQSLKTKNKPKFSQNSKNFKKDRKISSTNKKSFHKDRKIKWKIE